METLLDYLTSSNPILDSTEKRARGNTKSRNKSYDMPESLELWTDFDKSSLYAMLGGSLKDVLESQFDLHDFSYIHELPSRQISGERSLESFLYKWTQPTVTEALAKAQSRLQSESSSKRVYMMTGDQAIIPGKLKLFPDWAGVLQSAKTSGRPRNILPGDTKPSKKWNSSVLQPGKRVQLGESLDSLAPINQIYTYCLRANARYGYLISDCELLAVRVRPADASPSDQSAAERARKKGVLEYRSIPWANDKLTMDDGSGGLTVNLALWWLHMLVTAGYKVDNSYLPLRQVQRDSSDEVEVEAEEEEEEKEGEEGKEEKDLQSIGSSQDREAQTPSENGTRRSFSKTPGQSFQSETSRIGHDLSKTSLEHKRKRARPTPIRSSKKRTRDEREPGREPSRTRRRRNPTPGGKKA
ncbi:MAG: hypothetical protein Q9216_004347 [Gyalolechia sp. 2 TL-2023]